jgi:hypothetical protein
LEAFVISRAGVLSAAAVTTVLILGLLVWNPLSRDTYAQTAPDSYDNLLLCQLAGATKTEAANSTGITSLFSGTFAVRTRNWRWLADANMWHGEWWLRNTSGTGFSWVPVGTNMTCSFYPETLAEDWIVRPAVPTP